MNAAIELKTTNYRLQSTKVIDLSPVSALEAHLVLVLGCVRVGSVHLQDTVINQSIVDFF